MKFVEANVVVAVWYMLISVINMSSACGHYSENARVRKMSAYFAKKSWLCISIASGVIVWLLVFFEVIV